MKEVTSKLEVYDLEENTFNDRKQTISDEMDFTNSEITQMRGSIDINNKQIAKLQTAMNADTTGQVS